MRLITPVRLLLIGTPGSAFRAAAGMARDAGAEVAVAGSADDALDLMRRHGGDLIMMDVDGDIAGFIGRLRAERIAVPVLACGIDAPAAKAVAAIRAGARDYVPLPPDRDLIAAAITSVARRTARMAGNDPALARATALAVAVAPASEAILIGGEPGSGRETIARFIHDASGRPGRFLVVDCAALTADIAESELFGHETDAFPGAVAPRLGGIDEAADGTIFLREIAMLAPRVQAKLALMLQDQTVLRLGSSTPVPLRARLIASTHIDLSELANAGRFNTGLLARLGLARIALPPLRARAGDIGLLVSQFADRFAAENGLAPRRFSAAALTLLDRYAWPGNIGELEDVVHRAVLLAHGEIIAPEAIVLADGTALSTAGSMMLPLKSAVAKTGGFVGQTVEAVERELILRTLQQCRGNRTTASTILGISVRTMRNKLKIFIEAGILVAPAA